MSTIIHQCILATTQHSEILGELFSWREQFPLEQKVLFSTKMSYIGNDPYHTIILLYTKMSWDDRYDNLRKKFLLFIMDFDKRHEYGCQFVELQYGQIDTKIIQQLGDYT